MKKVLYTATVVKKHINAFHLPFLKMLHDKGYETYVAAKNDYKDKECNIPYCDHYYDIDFDRNPFGIKNIAAYKRLKQLIECEKFDIIHCHTPVVAVLTRFAARKTRKKNGTKVFYTAHGFHFFKGATKINWLLYYPMEKLCARFTDVLITINNEDYELAKKKMHAGAVCYIPGVGIDLNKFKKSEKLREEARAELGMTDELMLLSVGELNLNKNHETVIRALAKINDPTIHYFIAGDGDMTELLPQVASELGISDRIHLLGYRSDTIKLYNAADIFCFMSYREGLAVAPMEAMACELPIINSDARGVKDFYEDGAKGFMSAPNDIDAVAKAIISLRDDSKMRKRMGEHNAQVVQKYDVTEIVKKMEKLYDNVMQG